MPIKHKGVRIGYAWEVEQDKNPKRELQGCGYYLEKVEYKNERPIFPENLLNNPLEKWKQLRQFALKNVKTKSHIWERITELPYLPQNRAI